MFSWLFGRKEEPVDVSTQAMHHSIAGRNAFEAAGDAYGRGSIAAPHLDKIAHRELLIGKSLLEISEAYNNAQDASHSKGDLT